jgi:hypothetical protein
MRYGWKAGEQMKRCKASEYLSELQQGTTGRRNVQKMFPTVDFPVDISGRYTGLSYCGPGGKPGEFRPGESDGLIWREQMGWSYVFYVGSAATGCLI